MGDRALDRARPPKFPGRRVIAGCFIVLTVAAGLGFYGLAVYLNAFSRERGWPVTSISLATSVFFVVGGVVGVLAARIIAKRDVRAVIVAGAVIGAVALALLGRVETRWQLYLVYALFAFGYAGTGLVPVTTVVTRWYHERRSVALSIASTGLSVGGILITPAAKWLIDRQGMRAATPILAIVWLVGIVPFALWLVRPEPSRLGWLPDGEQVRPDTEAYVPTGIPFHVAVRSRFYICLTVGYVLIMAAQVGGIQQLIKLVEERSDKGTAALATIGLAGMSVLSRLAGGRMMSRLPMARFAVVLAVLQGLALVGIAFADHRVALYGAILAFGATVGNILMLQPLLVAERFGVLDYPRIFSRSQFMALFGTAGGPLLLGWLHDNAGGYQTSYIVAGLCSVAGGLVLLRGGPAAFSRLSTRPAAPAGSPSRPPSPLA